MTIAERVKELGLPTGSYAVFGSGPMAVRGMREAKDIDIIITSELFRKLKQDDTWKAEALRDHHEVLNRDGVSLFDSWAPDSWDIPAMIKEADVIEGVPFVKLETVLEWKKIRDLPKDKEDIVMIEKYLKDRK
jgi:hypothetical protein